MVQKSFGQTKKGEKTSLYIFTNKNGMTMTVSDFGATLQALCVPDKNGTLQDVVLGYDDPMAYEGTSLPFFGATIGRNANRIGGGAFLLNGKRYELTKNDGANCLHSGTDFYSFRLWKVSETTENSITFALHSPDGDQGFPGALDVKVKYILTDENEVKIEYNAMPEADTVINLTNHSYFNLNGHDSGNVLDHEVWIDADSYTRANKESIPTGEIVPVENTPMDFRVKKAIGRDIGAEYEALIFGNGYDHNWCLKNNGQLAKVAEASSEKSGISMEVYTDLPGVQMYTGNFISKEYGKSGVVYENRQGVCFETQYYPDAVNHENFPSPIFKKGEMYHTVTIYKFV